jgi:hypothetical protein
MNELTIDGKIYISSKKAAEITGYAKDYIGQLCREGHVEARMVGRSWYVLESSIRNHRFGGDAKSSGTISVQAVEEAIEAAPHPMATWEKPTYTPDAVPSMPIPGVQSYVPQEETPFALKVDTDSETVAAETLTDMQSAWKEWFAQKQDTLIETPEIIDAREDIHEEAHELPEIAVTQEYTVEEQPMNPEPQPITDPEELLEAPEEVSTPIQINQVHAVAAPTPVAYPAFQHAQEEGEIEAESEPVLIHRAAPSADYEEESGHKGLRADRDEDIQIPTKQERKRARAQKVRATRRNYVGPIVVRAILLAIILVTIAAATIASGYADRYIGGVSGTQPIVNFLGGTSTYSK